MPDDSIGRELTECRPLAFGFCRRSVLARNHPSTARDRRRKRVSSWQLAVGPSPRPSATTVDLVDCALVVRAADSRWMREIERARDVILARLQHLLGANIVSRLGSARATHFEKPNMSESVIVSAVRTPTGKFLGALKDFTAPQLGALVVREAVARAGIDPAIVDECIMGNVVQAGLGQNPARQAALNGGLHDRVAALTINKVCGSGLKAVMLAAQGIATGDIDIAVAGGMESMSNAPYLLPRVREGLRMGNGKLVDSMIHDGLWCSFEQLPHGHVGRGRRRDVPRRARRAGRATPPRATARRPQATREGWFKDEILPVSIPQKKGAPLVVDRDEPIREDTTDGVARRAEAGVQEGRHRDGRQRARRERRRRALVVMAADARSELGADAAGAHRRAGDERPRAEAGA